MALEEMGLPQPQPRRTATRKSPLDDLTQSSMRGAHVSTAEYKAMQNWNFGTFIETLISADNFPPSLSLLLPSRAAVHSFGKC